MNVKRIEELKKIFDMPENEREKALKEFYIEGLNGQPYYNESELSWDELKKRIAKIKYDPNFVW